MLNSQIIVTFISWFKKGSFAVLDQALFAGTNFIVGVLLARWLEPLAYGAFSTAYAVFLFVGTLHTALWTEPMLVYGSGRFQENYRDYQNVLLTYHWRFGILCALGFAVASMLLFSLSQPELGLSFAGLAIASPLILYLWLIRRSAYVLLKPQYAVLGGGVYLLIYLSIIIVCLYFQILNAFVALGVMGIASIISGKIVQMFIATTSSHDSNLDVEINNIVDLHWGYGKWALISGSIYWIPGNLMFILLPMSSDLVSVGILKALMNLILPLAQFNAALGPLLLPSLVRAYKSDRMALVLYRFVLFQTAIAIIYWLILGLFNKSLIAIFYGDQYKDFSFLLWYLGLSPLLSGLTTVLSSGLRAIEQPQKVFLAYFTGTAIILPIYVYLILYFNVVGAILALIIAFASINIALGYIFYKETRYGIIL